ncbi:hypothetical protein Cgig2_013175 [Carnegiea gigantea]|uniref:Uncharacterized protein n=1 Tax=Carnegiea gigantea TaxID=171969 RepID=A0A9Q1GUY9_9CARY|nr:hypothetical protein Cgig2_013175 [Carnegiea gigantea]
MEDGIRPLKTDYDSLEVAECTRKIKKISAYIIHKVDKPLVIPAALPSCEAEKETCTSKQPKSADKKRVKHAATKRTSPRGKVPPSNAKDVTSKEKGPIATINNSGSKEKGPVAAAEVSSPRQKALSATSKGRSLIETIYPTATNSSRQREKGPLLLLKAQVQNKGSVDIISGFSRTSVYEPESDEWEDMACNEDASSKDKRKRKYNDATERNDDDVLKTKDDVLEDELHNVEDIETSDKELEVTINSLRKFKIYKELEAQRAAAEHNSEVPTTYENDSEYAELNADLNMPPITDEEDNMIQSRRNKKERVKVDEHTDYKKLRWEVGMTFGIMHEFKFEHQPINQLDY